jgi:15-cis-phytoene synthase
MKMQHQPKPQAVMNTHAKSFSWAAKFLAPETREPVARLYALARLLDDWIDEPSLGDYTTRLQQFDHAAGSFMGDSVAHSLASEIGSLLRSQGVAPDVISTFVNTLRQDGQERHLHSSSELLAFAYGVAGTVGQMMRPLLGATPAADSAAVALGMGMQLTNIARDVMEDAQRNRCYLPSEWLPAEWQLSQLLAHEPAACTAAFEAVKRLLAQAEIFYAQGEQGLMLIPAQNRRAIRIALVLYRAIGRKILRQGRGYLHSDRVHLNVLTKLSWIAYALMPGTIPKPSSPVTPPIAYAHPALLHIPGFPS